MQLNADTSRLIWLTKATDITISATSKKAVNIGIILTVEDDNTSMTIRLAPTMQGAQCFLKIITVCKRSKLSVRGEIVVATQLSEIQLHYHHTGIVMDTATQITSEPVLFLGEGDIKAGHGSVIRSIRPEEVSYLLSRGITRQKAKSMLCLAEINALCSWVLMK